MRSSKVIFPRKKVILPEDLYTNNWSIFKYIPIYVLYTVPFEGKPGAYNMDAEG